MPLSIEDRNSYKEGMLELYSELGSTLIEYYEPSSSKEDDFYGEEETIDTFICNLTGFVKAYKIENDSSIGINAQDKELYAIDIVLLSLEENELNPIEMYKGKFKYHNRFYSILRVAPKNPFSDFYTSYEFICEVV